MVDVAAALSADLKSHRRVRASVMAPRIGLVCFFILLIAVLHASSEENGGMKDKLGKAKVRAKRQLGWRDMIRVGEEDDYGNGGFEGHHFGYHNRRGMRRGWRHHGMRGGGRRGHRRGRGHCCGPHQLNVGDDINGSGGIDRENNDTNVSLNDRSEYRGYHGMHHGRRGGWGYGHHGMDRDEYGNDSEERGHGHYGRFHGMHNRRGYGMRGRQEGNIVSGTPGRFDGHGMPHGYGHERWFHNRHNRFRQGNIDGERQEGNSWDGDIDSETGFPSLSENKMRKIAFLARAQNQFTARLHEQVGFSDTEIVYSPYGIFQALTMAYMGSRGHTAFQLRRVLHLVGMGRHIHLPVMHQNVLLHNTGGANLEIANNLVMKSNVSVSETFHDRLESSYDASVSHFDWDHQNGPEGSINEWVLDQTHTHIPNVLAPGAVSHTTSMVLVNAIYFKAKWKVPFRQERTSLQLFSATRNQQVAVQMMEMQGQFKMGEVPGHAARVLELPYGRVRFSMLVILPDDIGGMASLEADLTPDVFSINLEAAVPVRVNVFLPRFRLESPLSLKEALQNMGITKAFDESRADFRGITHSHNDLYLSDVIHRAVVEIDEEGSESAETGVITNEGSVPSSPPVSFRCDHPFLFIIRDNVSKVNIFIGKFSGGS